MVVSLKANKKRIAAFLLLMVVVVGACLLLRNKGETEPKEIPGGTNEERVAFLQGFGWEVETEPSETREVMIPAQFNDVYTTYNVMQKAQGFDLKPYAGEVCTQYKYKVNNYPNEPEVYATLLLYGDRIIGGDIACAEVDGFMHGFAADSARFGEAKAEKPESSDSESSAVKSESQPSQAGSAAETSAAEGSAESENTASQSSLPEGNTERENTASAAGEVIPEDAFPTD